ncbi:Conserved oligomeric Golgi complex subunit 7 [Nakaseomyces bracarensis]|uniref:Conserved oligomeric Golgi complex subunit 7 n=1 Tax=Nakaseomyces bracarensis TaxID=273131 RepID=A0ABR4NPK9_9SACH
MADHDMREEDDILNMFFDEQFIPQAFVDILLSKTNGGGLDEVRTVTTGLQGRLDYYTEHLTKELENTIYSLEKISDTLPGTWNSTEVNTSGTIGASKLEYYLDTLANAVRGLEADVKKLDHQVNHLQEENLTSNEEHKLMVTRLQELNIARNRMSSVLKLIEQLESIVAIGKGDNSEPSSVAFKDFKLALTTLEETIVGTLEEAIEKESSNEQNREILERIDMLVELEQVLKDINPFYDEYCKFVQVIVKSANEYINTKNIDNDL